MKRISILLIMISTFVVQASWGAMQHEEIKYQHGDTNLVGHVYWDDAFEGKRPAVMVFYEWWGLNDYALLRAEMLAESGYVAFVVDMYGDGRRTRHPEDAKSWMQEITKDITLWRDRAQIGYEQLLKHDSVDPKKTAAVGYCFGGATVMQLAYSGVEINGVVSVHGSLPAANDDELNNIKPRILVLHGADDSFIPKENIEKFSTALTKAGADWEMNIYGGAKHSFSNPYADGYGIEGIEFNETAEQRSWARTLSFLEELFSDEEF